VEWSGWIHRPTLKEVSDLYPSGANHRRLDGYVVLACTIRADTRTRRCEVTTERPRGEGFGAAALRMTDLFRMHPVRIDGQVSEKVRVLVPIHFGGSGQDGPTQTLTPAPTILLEADK
ncbi:MAG: TonB family protein, partial [Caulobacteraceae bacterium]